VCGQRKREIPADMCYRNILTGSFPIFDIDIYIYIYTECLKNRVGAALGRRMDQGKQKIPF